MVNFIIGLLVGGTLGILVAVLFCNGRLSENEFDSHGNIYDGCDWPNKRKDNNDE